MLVGIYFLVLDAIVLLEKLIKLFRHSMVILISSCFILTLWGTVESIFANDTLFDPSGIKIERGGISQDPGSKATGYLIRKYVNPAQKVLAIHDFIEPPILFYYFGRFEYSFYDLSSKETIDKFHELKDKVDIVICDVEQSLIVDSDGRFIRRSEILSENVPRMLIYTRPYVEMPVISVDVRDLNASFDREYSWRVSLR